MNKLSEWCDRNSLLLNVGRCNPIKFARSRHPVKFSYMLGGIVLDRVNSINDLGGIMDEKMTYFGAFGRHGCKGLCDARIFFKNTNWSAQQPVLYYFDL
jgi:hypothetical protein